MFLKFICKAFFAKNIVKSVRNGGINGRSSLPVLFSGRVRLFGKTGSHSRESLATNAAGKNDLLWGQNKVEWNCRHTRGTQQIKSRSCRTVFLCGSFCFSVLIGTPNTGCPVLGVFTTKIFRFVTFSSPFSAYKNRKAHDLRRVFNGQSWVFLWCARGNSNPWPSD